MRIQSLFMILMMLLSLQGFCLSEHATISILTIKPGKELYTIFGHTAIRITDEKLSIDRIYNYGTFDFHSPFFYIDFLKGNLNYFLSIEDYNTFIKTSTLEQRMTFEQTIELNTNEKIKIYNNLEKCYHSAERYYRYNFYYDNCATRVRDVIFNNLDKPVEYDTNQYCCMTFRQLLKPYIAEKYWIDLGINLVLGKEADITARSIDFMFLPDYIMRMLQNTERVNDEKILIDVSVSHTYESDFSYVWPWILTAMMLLLTTWNKSRKIVLHILCTVVGFTGLFLLIVSIITENSAFSSNMNIGWMFPSLFILFIRNNRVNDILKILYITVLFVMILLWNRLPQHFSNTFLPWVLCLIMVQIMNIQWIGRKFSSLKWTG
ncbi:MAG: DUF4105 domain-containing protein [Bacteroidales bacterium]|nr:DUF4105 domain-containing protein [Bacteroidales bacterium]